MITSLTNKAVKDLIKLKQKKYRDDYYLVEGEHLVEEALKSNVVDLLISTKEIQSDYDLLLVSEEVMARLAFTKTPQSIMARCRKEDKHEIIDGCRYLLLDSLQDPGNIGTLIRTALAFGIDQVILSNDCVELYNDKLLRSMQGAHFNINCIYKSLDEAIDILKNKGVYVVGSSLDNGIDINQVPRNDKMAFIVGNEGNGMSKEILAKTDKNVYIPIAGIESLNVAIAGSIMMYNYR